MYRVQWIILAILPVMLILLIINQGNIAKLKQPRPVSDRKLIFYKYNPKAKKYHDSLAWFQKAVISGISSEKCFESRCDFTSNQSELFKADAVISLLDYMVKSPHELRPLSLQHQVWIMLYLESSPLLFQFGRKDSDVIVKYGQTNKRPYSLSDNEVASLFPSWRGKQTFINYDHDKDNSTELAPVVCSHCKTSSKRETFIAEMQKYIGIHIYGKCGSKKCGTRRYIQKNVTLKNDPCFKMTNKKYAFIIAFENGLCKDYASEKNAIPIVLAGNLDLDIFPPHSVIYVANFSGPKELTDYLHYLMRNETAYMEYFDWRKSYFVKGYESTPTPCDLCLQLHNKTTYMELKNRPLNLHKWLFKDSECFIPDNGVKSVLSILKENITVPEDTIIAQWRNKYRNN